jgi:tetratricopeptide (TPR) repeat protein
MLITILEYIFWSILLVATLYLWFRLLQKRSRLSPLIAWPRLNMKPGELQRDLVLKAVTEMGCKYEDLSEDKDDKSRFVYAFDFQGGHFVLFFLSDYSVTSLHYYGAFFTTPDHYNKILNICNQVNESCKYVPTAVCSYDKDSDRVAVHINSQFVMHNSKDAVEVFSNAILLRTFALRDDITARFSQSSEEDENSEQEAVLTAHQKFLLYEQELNHDDNIQPRRFAAGSRLLLGSMLPNLFDVDVQRIRRMVVTTDAESHVVDRLDEILSLDLSSLLVEPPADSHPLSFRNRNVHLCIDTNPNDSDTELQSLISIFLRAENVVDNTLYVRVTAFTPTTGPDVDGRTTDEDGISQHLMIAFDAETPEKKLAEFKFVKSETIDKEVREEPLSDDEALLSSALRIGATYPESLYRGNKYYRQRRFYDALCYYADFYWDNQQSYNEMSKEDQQMMRDVAFRIGYCYVRERDYERAYYYLSRIAGRGNIDYDMEFVNCLSNSRDCQAIDCINSIIKRLDEMRQNNDGAESPAITSYRHFLYRRHAFCLLDRGNLDKAEAEFKKLLDIPDSNAYALKELAYIQKQKKTDQQTE